MKDLGKEGHEPKACWKAAHQHGNPTASTVGGGQKFVSSNSFLKKKDVASQNIKKCLIEDFGFKESIETFEGEPVYKKGEIKLITTQKALVEAEHLDKYFPEIGFFIFASKHKSEKGVLVKPIVEMF